MEGEGGGRNLHFDPRRWQVHDRGIDEPFEKVTGNGLYLGFKIYTAQGYRPWDIRRLPILKKFYKRCCNDDIPVLNHCTPDGANSFDRKIFLEFVHPADSAEDAGKKKSARSAEDYFNQNFISPAAWKEVLDSGEYEGTNLKDLRLCLAHFGGSSKTGREWIKDIIELVKKYDNVYTDISSSFANQEFRDYFKANIYTSPEFEERIRDKIIFGTDWYMTLMDRIDYVEYCDKAKRFLDEFDTSLWIRFTQSNPYEFYGLADDSQVARIARNIENVRQQKEIKEAIGDFKEDKIKQMYKEAAYIRSANDPYWEQEIFNS